MVNKAKVVPTYDNPPTVTVLELHLFHNLLHFFGYNCGEMSSHKVVHMRVTDCEL